MQRLGSSSLRKVLVANEHRARLAMRPLAYVRKAGRSHDYYLDLSQLRDTTSREVEELLDGFWQRIRHHEHRSEALAALGLDDPVSYEQVRQRYRELAYNSRWRRRDASIAQPSHGGARRAVVVPSLSWGVGAMGQSGLSIDAGGVPNLGRDPARPLSATPWTGRHGAARRGRPAADLEELCV